MKKLLTIAHTPSTNTRRLLQSMLKAARSPEIEDLNVEMLSPFDTHYEHIAHAEGILLFTTENFAYMSGALKDMFDRVYMQCLDSTAGKAWCLCIRAGKDGTGALNSVESIARGLRWKTCQSPLILKGDFRESFIHQSEEFSMTFAAGLAAGIY